MRGLCNEIVLDFFRSQNVQRARPIGLLYFCVYQCEGPLLCEAVLASLLSRLADANITGHTKEM